MKSVRYGLLQLRERNYNDEIMDSNVNRKLVMVIDVWNSYAMEW